MPYVDFTLFAAVLGAYLLGALPFAVLIARAFGLPDPRTYGSGNPGATNVARSGGKLPAALTLFADFGKGFLPVFWLGGENPAVFAAAGAAAVAGHVFSVFLRFRGGKGMATALGVFFAWHWPAGLAAAAVWGLVFLMFRISSAASVTAIAAAAAITAAATNGAPAMTAAAAVGILVIFRHRRNIADIWRGRESHFGKKPPRGGEFARRMCRAAVVLSGVLFATASVHDYPTTRRQIDLIRTGDSIAVQKPWIAVFFFLNEFGSGLKFFLTGNEKYMGHYPSASHLHAMHVARAENGGWEAQVEVARRYYFGEGAPQDGDAAMLWLRRALDNAPAANRPQIEKIIRGVEDSENAAP